ncbi:CBM35 domain-containing protein [Micromonospora sp. KC606]|uniref:CBM35 domain-containing protein n=1 Tax=Micromonospora sp. KC606 TaxID=2530379 RepID=UPI001A9EA049|nr:CBM35 domain-containing protein [Micromonospora sp. KC606]
MQVLLGARSVPDAGAVGNFTQRARRSRAGIEQGRRPLACPRTSALWLSRPWARCRIAPGPFRQSAPIAVSSTTYNVVNGSISVPANSMNALEAYQLLITPAAGAATGQQRYEAENATVVNAGRFSSGSASDGGYVGQIDGSANMRDQSFVDFLVNVPQARAYTMNIRYANATGANATHGLASNGGGWSTVTYPPTGAWGSFGASVNVSVNLNAGWNMIRLAKGAPNFAGGVGFAELDAITLS